MCFGQIKQNHKNKKHNIEHIFLPEPGFEPGTSCTEADVLPPLNQLKVSIFVKMCNCFNDLRKTEVIIWLKYLFANTDIITQCVPCAIQVNCL